MAYYFKVFYLSVTKGRAVEVEGRRKGRVCVRVCVCVYVFLEVALGREMMNIPLWLPLHDKTLTFIPKRKNVEVLPSWKV